MAPVFYATSLLALALLAGYLTLGACWLRKWAVAALFFVATIGFIVLRHVDVAKKTLFAVEEKNLQIRMVSWNVAHTHFGHEPIMNRLIPLQADLMALAEVGKWTEETQRAYETNFPKHQAVLLGHEMAVIHRGKLIGKSVKYDHEYGGVCHVEFEFDDTPLHLVFVDLKPQPYRSKKKHMAFVYDELEQIGKKENVIIAGDFNLPLDSIYLEDLRENYDHCAKYVSGWIETWPRPIPLLTIDHVWAGRDLSVTGVERTQVWCSDHVGWVVDFQVK